MPKRMSLSKLGIEENTDEILSRIAHAFRDAFDQTDFSNAHGFLSSFPKGNCNRATLFIGRFLYEEYNLSGYEVCGEREGHDGLDSHAWLEIGSTIIDITSDQYDANNPKVIVSSNSDWHKSWEKKTHHKIADIMSQILSEDNKIYLINDDNKVYLELKEKVLKSTGIAQ